MLKKRIIKSESRDYTVDIISDWDFMDKLTDLEEPVYVVDFNVYRIYRDKLFRDLPEERIVLFEANERNKTLQGLGVILKNELRLSVRNKRNTNFVSFGGGITQEVTGFIASTLYRGIEHWVNVPTTLLAQSDTCIGGKTSLNVPPYKNILGTFFPPHETYLNPRFVAMSIAGVSFENFTYALFWPFVTTVLTSMTLALKSSSTAFLTSFLFAFLLTTNTSLFWSFMSLIDFSVDSGYFTTAYGSVFASILFAFIT